MHLSAIQSEIAWYENVDGNGRFSQQRIITTDVGFARSIHAEDIDGDGDAAVLSASLLGPSCHCPRESGIAWYENENGAFGPQTVIGMAVERLESVYAADIDNDGDVDVLSASWRDGKIAWYEITDGMGTFSEQRVITTEAFGATSVYAVDIDNDGDVDVLSGSWNRDNNVAWYENIDGNGVFGDQQVIASESGVWSVYAADVNGDGDVDVLSASETTDRIAWYQQFDAAAGDANRDFQFDQEDIIKVLLGGKYLTAEKAVWKEGDWNGDGVFDRLDIVAALQTGNYLQGPYALRGVDTVL